MFQRPVQLHGFQAGQSGQEVRVGMLRIDLRSLLGELAGLHEVALLIGTRGLAQQGLDMQLRRQGQGRSLAREPAVTARA